ncbi:MAG: LysM domain-containing protein [Pseudomonadota bacterium]
MVGKTNARTAMRIATSGAALAIMCACANTETLSVSDPYAKLAYVGAQQLYKHDRVAPLLPPLQTVGEDAVPLVPVSYAGVEGAREAHAFYPVDVAEQLDGRCEPVVRAAAGENLEDMSDLCDIGMAKLVAYNPGVENPYQVAPGALVDIPGASRLSAATGIASATEDLVGLYEVRAGESVSDVAAKFSVSTATVLAMNPQARWAAPDVGDQLRVPVPGATVAIRDRFGSRPVVETGEVTAAAATAAPASAWVGYAGVAAPEEDEDALTAKVHSHMPFADGPVDAVDPTEANRIEASVRTDRAYVAEGGAVTVTLKANPGEVVTFYRGKTTTSADASKTVVAGANGEAMATFRTPEKASDLGGYVFSATRESESDAYFSRRVGVLKRRDKSADASSN